MVVGAVGLLGYPTYTNIRASREQTALRTEFLTSSKLKQAYQAASSGGVSGSKVTLAEGSAVTRIQIPKIGLDTVVVQRTSDQALAAGSGHYPQTPLPCPPKGNVRAAGPRTLTGRTSSPP